MAERSGRPDHPPARLVAIDLDGTLLGPDGVLSERSADAIRAASEAGWIVTLATGRPPHMVAHLSDRLAGTVDYVAPSLHPVAFTQLIRLRVPNEDRRIVRQLWTTTLHAASAERMRRIEDTRNNEAS